MGDVFVNIILQELIVSIVPPFTMTNPGLLQMDEQELQMDANQNPDFLSPPPSLILGMFQLVNAMGTLTLVTLIWTHGWHQGTKVGAFVTTVNIILKDSTVNVASQAIIEILESLFLLLTPANCALATLLDQPCFLLATALSVTLAMVIVPANLEWLVLSVIGYWGFGHYGCRPCDCAGSCDSINGDCINSNADIEWYHEIPGLYAVHNKSEVAWEWEEEQGYSALRHSGKCECKDQVLQNFKIFCAMKYT
ncbi:hypothetical protein E2320_003913, partial [Naja naja]